MNCKLVLRRSAKTYLNANKKECHYYDLVLVFENGREVPIKPKFENDKGTLNAFATYEK